MNEDNYRQILLEEWLTSQLPISFIYDRKESESLLAQWKKTQQSSVTDGYTIYSIQYQDPTTNLCCKITLKSFLHFPALDWVIEFENKGTKPTPILEDIMPLQWLWDSQRKEKCSVNYNKGSDCKIDDFLPQTKLLEHWTPFVLSGVGGRSFVSSLPFMHLQCEERNLIVAIGWSGQWICKMTLNQSTKKDLAQVILEAGMEHTHLRLNPGEKIRTPRILLFFSNEDPRIMQNQFRRLILEHYSPKINGQRVTVPLAYPTWGGAPITEHLARIKSIQENKLAYEYYWIDAAWFLDESVVKTDEASGTWANWVGRWRPNKNLYPNGLKPLSDAIHKAGMKFLLWLEIERARIQTEWPKQYPQYYLKRNEPSIDLLFDLGNPEARQFLTQFLINFIQENGLDCYRQDFNFDPLPYWQAKDTPDRIGMAEIQHIVGLYQLWDDILAKFPSLFIDNCASGGRRIDIETMKRSIPLWRSDTQCFQDYDPTASQVATYGLMPWEPLSSTGTGNHPMDDYYVRSSFSTGLVFHQILKWEELNPKTYPWDWHRKMIREFFRARPIMEGDFFPLTSCSISLGDWCASQWHRDDLNAGLILAFRRPQSPFLQAQFPLGGINPKKHYQFEDADTGQVRKINGKEILQDGLLITVSKPRSCTLVFYSIMDSK